MGRADADDRPALLATAWSEAFGPRARAAHASSTQRHNDVAAALQAMLEEAYLHLVRAAHSAHRLEEPLPGGRRRAERVANGRIRPETPFEDVYVQPAAGDAGIAVGAALLRLEPGARRSRAAFVMEHAYTGPAVHRRRGRGRDPRRRASSPSGSTTTQLFAHVAERIADGDVVGWFQGRMEFGPRALGNRSIVADPRRHDMKDILNARIKHREPFRPFAPSILAETAGE